MGHYGQFGPAIRSESGVRCAATSSNIIVPVRPLDPLKAPGGRARHGWTAHRLFPGPGLGMTMAARVFEWGGSQCRRHSGDSTRPLTFSRRSRSSSLNDTFKAPRLSSSCFTCAPAHCSAVERARKSPSHWHCGRCHSARPIRCDFRRFEGVRSDVIYARTSTNVSDGFRTSIEAVSPEFGGYPRTLVALGVGSSGVLPVSSINSSGHNIDGRPP
jgi:hypothetical protein